MDSWSSGAAHKGLTVDSFERKVGGNLADFRKVMENAKAQGINLAEVAIKYDGLTDQELEFLRKHQEVTHGIAPGRVLAKFPKQGFPLFEEKATVHHLGG